MLFDPKLNGNKIHSIPHSSEYEAWKSRLTEEQFQAVFDELDSRVGEGDVHTSSWMPGRDWSHTVFQPLYDHACGRDKESAAMCFGLILWEVMMKRPEAWSFGRYPRNGIEIKGMTYFRLPGLDRLC